MLKWAAKLMSVTAEDSGLHVREVEDAGQGGRWTGNSGPHERELGEMVSEVSCGMTSHKEAGQWEQ